MPVFTKKVRFLAWKINICIFTVQNNGNITLYHEPCLKTWDILTLSYRQAAQYWGDKENGNILAPVSLRQCLTYQKPFYFLIHLATL